MTAEQRAAEVLDRALLMRGENLPADTLNAVAAALARAGLLTDEQVAAKALRDAADAWTQGAWAEDEGMVGHPFWPCPTIRALASVTATDDADAERDALRKIVARFAVCHEEVSRRGESQPCDKTAVALRYDPAEGSPYPVCAYHSRTDMVPLTDLRAALDTGRGAT